MRLKIAVSVVRFRPWAPSILSRLRKPLQIGSQRQFSLPWAGYASRWAKERASRPALATPAPEVQGLSGLTRYGARPQRGDVAATRTRRPAVIARRSSAPRVMGRVVPADCGRVTLASCDRAAASAPRMSRGAGGSLVWAAAVSPNVGSDPNPVAAAHSPAPPVMMDAADAAPADVAAMMAVPPVAVMPVRRATMILRIFERGAVGSHACGFSRCGRKRRRNALRSRGSARFGRDQCSRAAGGKRQEPKDN